MKEIDKIKFFIRCYRCKELRGCEMMDNTILSCSARECSYVQYQECEEKMRQLINDNEDGHRAFKCTMCAYKDDKNRLRFASDE